MRRFLIDTRNQCAPGGGSHGTERNSSDNEAQRVPDQPETQPILEPQEIRALTSKFGAKGTTRSTRHRSNFGATGDANRDTSKFGANGTT